MTLTLVKGIDPFNLFLQLLPLASTICFYGCSSYLALTTKAGENTARLQSQSSWKAIVTTKTAILFIYGMEAIILMAAKWTAGISSSEPRAIFICGSALSWTVLVSGVRKTSGSVAAQYRVIWLAYILGESLLLSEIFLVRTSDDWCSLFHITAHILKLLLLLTLCLVYKDTTSSPHRADMDEKQRPLSAREAKEQNTVIPRMKKVLRFSMQYLWPDGKPWLKVKLVQILLITGCETALNIIVPQQLGNMSDELNTSNSTVWAIFVYMMLKFLHGKIIGMIRWSIWLSYKRAYEEALLVDTYNHIMHLSMDFHEGKVHPHNVEEGLYIVHFAHVVLLEIIPNMLRLLSIITSLISDFGNEMGLIIAAVLLMFTSFRKDDESSLYEEKKAAWSEKYHQLQSSLQNWVYIDQFNQIDIEVKRFAELVNRKHTLDDTIDHSSNIQQLKRSLIFMAGSLAACANVSALIREDGVSSGNILRLIAYWEGLSGSILFFDNNIKSIKNHARATATFLELFERKPTITDKEDARSLVIKDGVIEFKEVSFRKLQGISFKCGGGQMVGCVGLNGAGKSTMMMLLARLYDPESGSIEIDEQDITNVTTASLRDQLYLLTQDSPKMGKTIRENLRYCRPEVTDERIHAAALKVGLYDLDKDDEKLSGGELQKLALARAIIRDPKIFLLDEPTSALDNTAQETFRHILMEIALGRTAFVVAHRMQTIVHADLILVFEEGQIVQQGTHKELVSMEGLYRRLWDAEHPGEMRETATYIEAGIKNLAKLSQKIFRLPI